MDALKQFTSLISERYGAIDNMKFLVGSDKNVTKDDVMCELARVASAVRSGQIVPTDDFSEPGINAAPIQLVDDAIAARNK